MQSRTPTEPFTKSGHSPFEPIGLPSRLYCIAPFDCPFKFALLTDLLWTELFHVPLKNNWQNRMTENQHTTPRNTQSVRPSVPFFTIAGSVIVQRRR